VIIRWYGLGSHKVCDHDRTEIRTYLDMRKNL